MSRQASPTTIGAFVVGAVALAIAAIVLLAGDQWFRQDVSRFVMYFHGSVNGLNVGSPVMFRGVNIGTVTDIQLVVGRTETDVDIPVIVEIDNSRFVHTHPESPKAETDDDIDELIKLGLRAQLHLQSLLTGQLFIQLDFQPGTPINLIGDGMYQSKYDEIPTIPTPIERLSKSLQNFPADEVLKNIVAIAEGMDKLVNSPQLTASLTALHAALDELKSLVTKINTEASPLASNANSMVDDARAVLGNINTAVDDAKGALRQAEITLKSTDDLVGNEQLVIQMEQALTAITSAARSIQLLAEEIERRPESLIRGRQ